MLNIHSMYEKYKDLSASVKAVFWFTVCNLMQRGISMITTPIFTRLLPTDEYGLYSTYLSWENVLLMIVSLCLYKSIMNLYIKYDDQESVLSAVCGLEMILSGTWMAIAVVFREQLALLLGISSALVCCLFVSFVGQSAFYCWSLYKRYIYDYKILVLVTLLMTAGSSILGGVAVIFIRQTAVVRAVSSTIVILFIGIFIYVSVFHRSGMFYDKEVWRYALFFCIPLMPHYLSEFILQSSDKIMINYMCGSHEVAIYSIAYAVGSLITLVTSSINASFAPYQYQKMKAGEYDMMAKRTNQVLLFVGVMLAIIMLFSREIVLIFGGKKYEESISVIIPICLGVYFNYMFQLFARIQEFYERKFTVVIPSILCAALNLITNYIFIRIYGFAAAAYTTFGCYFIFCFLHYLFYRKVCREVLGGKQLYNIKGLALISVTVISAGVLITLINQVLWIKYSLIGLVILMAGILRKKIVCAVKIIVSKRDH